MGEAKRRGLARQYSTSEFLRVHPVCCYCGAEATTTDHCPPRAAFLNRTWPEGYEFPCCKPCNDRDRLSEQVVSVLLKPSITRESTDIYWKRTLASLKTNHPELLAEWLGLTRNQQRNLFRKRFGSTLGDHLRMQEFGAIKLGKISLGILRDFFLKLAQALFYHHVERRCLGRVYVHLIDPMSKKGAAEAFTELTPHVVHTKRGNEALSEQFVYRYNVVDEGPGSALFCALVFCGEQIAAIILSLDTPWVERLSDGTLDPYEAQRDC